MTTDTTAPSAPTGLGGTVVGRTVNLTWTGSTDDVGVARYNVHRGTTAGFTPTAGNRIAQPTGTSYADTGLARHLLLQASPPRTPPATSAPPRTSTRRPSRTRLRPRAPSGVTAVAAGSTVNVSWTAATDNVGVVRYNLHRGATSGFTPSVVNRIAQPTGTSTRTSRSRPAPTSTS